MNKNVGRIQISKAEAEAMNKETSLIVHIWPSKSLINATNLLAVRRCHRSKLNDFLDYTGIQFILCRAYGMQGTYISYDDGLRLCNALEFSKARLNQIKKAMSENWLGPVVDVQHLPSVDFGAVQSKLTAEKAAKEETDVRKHEFLVPCSPIGDSTKLNGKEDVDNLDDGYYVEDEGIEELLTRPSLIPSDSDVRIISNQDELRQSRKFDDGQRTDRDSSRKENRPTSDDKLDHNRSERRNTAAKKTRKRLSEAHRATLETAYHQNPTLNRVAQAGIAEKLRLEKDQIYVSPFSKASFPYMLTATVL